MDQLFYLQDSRGHADNYLLFWAENGKGYTTDISRAQVFTQIEAIKQHESRHTDIPVLKSYIDAKSQPVHFARFKREEAIAGTGIILLKEKYRKPRVANCCGCGKFISLSFTYTGVCPHCGADNRP